MSARAPDTEHYAPMDWAAVQALPKPSALPRLRYGVEDQQFGELRLPPGVPGPFPVVVLIHGGCWQSGYDYDYVRPLAEALSTLGVATWTIEYRRLGNGGGWPETFRDVAHATDHLRVLAQNYPLNLKKVAAVGHSAGGQLALWLASRARIDQGDALYVRNPLKLQAVIGLAAITDLESYRIGPADSCHAAVEPLLGGTPAEQPQRYARVSPIALLPLGVPQWFVHGRLDPIVADATVLRYSERARANGDRVTLGVTSNAGHFEPVVPGSTTWLALQQAVVDALLQ